MQVDSFNSTNTNEAPSTSQTPRRAGRLQAGVSEGKIVTQPWVPEKASHLPNEGAGVAQKLPGPRKDGPLSLLRL